MTAAQQRSMIENYVNAYNRFDINGMLADLHEEVVFQNFSGDEVSLKTESKAAFRTQAEVALNYFSERQQSITSWQWLSPSVVQIDLVYRAVLAIDFPNGMKAGETLELTGRSKFTFQEQQIIGIADYS